MDWNFPETQSNNLNKQEIQDLIVITYAEEQDKWKNDILKIESDLLKTNKEIEHLKIGEDIWWEAICKLFGRRTNREKLISVLENELAKLNTKYFKRLSEMPKPEAYELAMFGGSLFKAK